MWSALVASLAATIIIIVQHTGMLMGQKYSESMYMCSYMKFAMNQSAARNMPDPVSHTFIISPKVSLECYIEAQDNLLATTLFLGAHCA